MKYKVYNKANEFLGIINGRDPLDAMKEARLFDMDTAERVEECTERNTKKTFRPDGFTQNSANVVIPRARRKLMN